MDIWPSRNREEAPVCSCLRRLLARDMGHVLGECHIGGLLANWRQAEILGEQMQVLFLQVLQMGTTIRHNQTRSLLKWWCGSDRQLGSKNDLCRVYNSLLKVTFPSKGYVCKRKARHYQGDDLNARCYVKQTEKVWECLSVSEVI